MGLFSKNEQSYDLGFKAKSSSSSEIPSLNAESSQNIDPDTNKINEENKSDLTFTKYTQKDLALQIKLSKEEEKYYFEPSQTLCESYFKSLTYFLSSEIHTDPKKSKMSEKEVQQYLIEIFSKIENKSEVVKFLEKENVSQKLIFSEKVAAKTFYPGYSELNNKYHEVAKKQNFHFWYKNMNFNFYLTRENQSKHYWDRFDYYFLTPSDSTLFNMFVIPVLGFHAVVFSIAIPPIGGVVATTQTFAILTGIGTAKTVVENATKSAYNLVKKNKYFLADQELSIVKDNKLPNLDAIKSALKNIKESTSRTGQFNFYFANAFKYYCELKENCDKYFKFGSSYYTENIFLEQKQYEKEIPKIRDLYYKTLYYSRSNKIIADTLRIQLEALKASTLQSLYLLTSDQNKIGFFKSRDICLEENMSKIMTSKATARDANTRDIIYKYITSKYNKVDVNLAKQLTSFVLLTMMPNNCEIKNKTAVENIFNRQMEVDRKKTNYQTIKSYYDEFQHPADIARRGVYILANLPFSQAYFTQINNQTYAINAGAWVAFSIFDAILFASNSNYAKDKYATIRKWSGNIANGMYVGFHVAGAVNLFSNITGLFSNSIISNLAFSPFGLLIDVGIINLAGQVSANEAQIWKEIEEQFVQEKNRKINEKNNKLWDPAYSFFTHRAVTPGDSMHKLGNIFKKRLDNIAKLSVKINEDSIELIEQMKNFDNHAFKFFSRKPTEEDIIKKYTNTLMNLISLSKELEAYEYYMDNIVKDINEEIDLALKFYLTLISVEHRGAFSITQFAKNEKVYPKIFAKNEEKANV